MKISGETWVLDKRFFQGLIKFSFGRYVGQFRFGIIAQLHRGHCDIIFDLGWFYFEITIGKIGDKYK